MKTLTEYIQKKQISITTDCVDLGLPSGTLWGIMNIGATEGKTCEDWYGLYFAWGETNGYKASDKHDFNWDGYKFRLENKLSKYNKEDKLTQLEKEDDAAYQITKGKFRMPTDKELKELHEHTINKLVKNYNNINKLNGILFVSKKDKTKSMFIPASGYSNGSNFNSGNNFYLWSSILYDGNPYNASSLTANIDNGGIIYSGRCCGFAVRGVLNK